MCSVYTVIQGSKVMENLLFQHVVRKVAFLGHLLLPTQEERKRNEEKEKKQKKEKKKK